RLRLRDRHPPDRSGSVMSIQPRTFRVQHNGASGDICAPDTVDASAATWPWVPAVREDLYDRLFRENATANGVGVIQRALSTEAIFRTQAAAQRFLARMRGVMHMGGPSVVLRIVNDNGIAVWIDAIPPPVPGPAEPRTVVGLDDVRNALVEASNALTELGRFTDRRTERDYIV